MKFTIFYTIFSALFEMVLWLAAPFVPKITRMLIGRTVALNKIRQFRAAQPARRLVWFHAASVGEFEQALPVMKLLHESDEKLGIVVSFYSPSGYELRHKHPLIDLSFYLPSDRPWTMIKLVKRLRPSVLVLVKYEFWYNLISAAHRFSIPIISICCILKTNALKKWPYRVVLNKVFPLVHHFFVQNTQTAQVLKEAGYTNLTINGDTRVDRVLEIKEMEVDLSWLEKWKGNSKLLVIGSAWAEDILFLRSFLQHAVVEMDGGWKVLIVPHEIDESHLGHLTHGLGLPYERYTLWKENQNDSPILILDTLGLLSKVYRFADAAWIGGAFKTGLHNTLEPAVYGIPIGFGPTYEKFQEAKDLIQIGVARTFPSGGSVWEFFQSKTEIEEEMDSIRDSATMYFERQKGASQVIVQFITSEMEEK